jgi:hypothetical protein
MKNALSILFVTVLCFGCDGDLDVPDAALADAGPADTGPTDAGLEEEPRVGFEILQVRSAAELVVWINREMTQEEFDAIVVPAGWIKNQPRETDPDRGSFARSPDATVDGPLTEEEHFGHTWRHNATVIEANTPLDAGGLLRLNRVAKFHDVGFDAGRTLTFLVSPEGEEYVRISRDAGRTTDTPTLPDGWSLVERVTDEALSFRLPNPTLNIRADNEDSYQGPVPELASLPTR